MPDNQERFLELFQNQILKLDLAELDFGIYRIHGYRKDQINKYLTETLPNKLNATLSSFAVKRQSELELELAELGKKLDSGAKSLGLPTAFNADNSLVDAIKAFPDATKYFELSEEAKLLEVKKQFEPGEEAKIYNYLYHFFARYYADGDFLPTLKRGRSIQYFAPYNGQDVCSTGKVVIATILRLPKNLNLMLTKIMPGRSHLTCVPPILKKTRLKGKHAFTFP